MLADDRVVLGTDADRAVLGGNVFNRGKKNGRVFDVFGVGKNGTCESLLLMTAGLMHLVKEVLQFGVAGKHALIKVRGERNTVFTKNRNGSLDEFNLTSGQHGCISW